jgi:membrane-associated phospholipid phosphatase
MPPLYAQDPLSAVQRGPWRWVDLAAALADVGGQTWVLALLALALYAWRESEVKDVLRVFLPLAAALAAAAVLGALGRHLGAVPRPAGAGHGLASFLRVAFPPGHAASVAAFAAYSLLAYGRRARAALLLAIAIVAARAVAGGHWAWDLAGGIAAGAALGGTAYLAVLRAFPAGHLARLRAGRRAVRGAPAPAPPSA